MRRIFQSVFQRPQANTASHGGLSCELPRGLGFALPSIWIGTFESGSDFDTGDSQLSYLLNVITHTDNRMIVGRNPFNFPAWCAACGSVESMRFDWSLGSVLADGSIQPAWTETCVCQRCSLNSRMRALVARVIQHADYRPTSRCYVAERVTPSYAAFARHFQRLEGSEYLGNDKQPGEVVFVPGSASMVRHEDLTHLSFPDASFDWLITQDVFEHIPDYRTAFLECARVLAPGGHLVFSIPFNSSLNTTQIRAKVSDAGAIEHLLPPEIHGNPVDGNGALCFQNFGWDILDSLRSCGFSRAQASTYWAPWAGHLGFGGIVFCADR